MHLCMCTEDVAPYATLGAYASCRDGLGADSDTSGLLLATPTEGRRSWRYDTQSSLLLPPGRTDQRRTTGRTGCWRTTGRTGCWRTTGRTGCWRMGAAAGAAGPFGTAGLRRLWECGPGGAAPGGHRLLVRRINTCLRYEKVSCVCSWAFGMASLDHDGLYCRRSHRSCGKYRGKTARLGPTRTSCAELRTSYHQGVVCLREWSRLRVRRRRGEGAEPAGGPRGSGHGRGDTACGCSRSRRHGLGLAVLDDKF